MKPMDEPTRAIYSSFFSELWKFTKAYSHPETDEDWDVAFEEANRLAKYYNNNMFNHLICAILEEAQRVWMEEHPVEQKHEEGKR